VTDAPAAARKTYLLVHLVAYTVTIGLCRVAARFDEIFIQLSK
jgi:hypothetical protein